VNVCILGLGYVGLTLSVTLADCGVKVTGIDLNKNVINSLKNGIPTLSEKGLGTMLNKNLGKNLQLYEQIPNDEFDVFIICVGTPLNDKSVPVIEHVLNAAEQVATRIKNDNLLVLRSTVPVGLTRNTIVPKIEEVSGLKGDFDFVFAPERTAEGVALSELKKNPQIIGSSSTTALEKATKLFSNMVQTIVPVSSIETAEMIKLIDNSYRDTHFAYANELALICDALNLNVIECISKANFEYPRNNIPVPSPGVGGPCLSKDPYILSYSAKRNGFETQVITHSRIINELTPIYLATKISKKLSELGKNSNELKIFIIGFAFKGNPETDDVRNSPTLILLEHLSKNYPNIVGYDHVVNNEVIEKLGIQKVSIEEGFKNANCIIIMNNHKSYFDSKFEKLIDNTAKPCIFVDTWNMFKDLSKKEHIIYTGIGID